MSDKPPRYTQAFVREITAKVKQKNGRYKTVHRAWKGVLKYREDNPAFVERPARGEDTRTKAQRSRYVWKQVATTFDREAVQTKSQALEALAEWRASMEGEARRADMPSAKTTVHEYTTAYIDALEASENVSRRTVHGYRTIAKRIEAGFPDMRLCDLTPDVIQAWEGGLIGGGLSPNTVIKYHRFLSEVCKHAVEVEIMTRNPCKAVRTPKRKSPSPNALTAEGYARLAATLDAMEPTPIVTAAAIAMHTGMRQGEVCGLRWRCYDAEAGTLKIEEAIGRAGGGTFSNAPKTESSRRIVPVSRQLARMLDRRRARMVEDFQTCGINPTEEMFSQLYIIGHIDGRYQDPIQVSRQWRTLSSSFGLTGTQGRAVTFHDLRHSFATRAIAAGADVKAVAAVLGHTNAAITLNVYADADPESKRRASDLVALSIASQGELEPYATNAEV